MRRFVEWLPSPAQPPWTYIPSIPGALLLGGVDREHRTLITVNAGWFVLYLDDIRNPGSIPQRQMLGAIAEQPNLVFRRAMETTLAWGNQLIESSDWLGVEYISDVQRSSRWFDDRQFEGECNRALLSALKQRSLAEPERTWRLLANLAQMYDQRHWTEWARDARIEAGKAARLAGLEDEALNQFRTALRYIADDDIARRQSVESLIIG